MPLLLMVVLLTPMMAVCRLGPAIHKPALNRSAAELQTGIERERIGQNQGAAAHE